MTTFKLLMVLLLVLGNGFFVAAEFALVAIRRSRVEQFLAERRAGAAATKRATDNLDRYLAATQLGITIMSLGLGWIGEPALAHLIEPAFNHWLPAAWAKAGAHTIAVTIAFIVITALHIVLGELAPKSLAIQRAENVSLVVARPLEIFLNIFRPAIILLNGLGNAVVRMLGLQALGEGHTVHSAEELEMLVKSSTKEGALGKAEGEIIRGIFRMADQPVSAVMTPRPKMAWLDLDEPMAEIEQRIAQSPFSRLPVAQGNVENLLGILELRDLAVRGLPKTVEELKMLLRKPLFIPDSALSLRAIELLRQSKQEVALVVSEFGGIEGLLTLQDILNSITTNMLVGAGEKERLKQRDGSWLLNAFMSIDLVKEAFHLEELPADSEYHTLGGFVLHLLGRLPQPGDTVEHAGFRFEVVDMLGTRILHVRIRQTIAPGLSTE